MSNVLVLPLEVSYRIVQSPHDGFADGKRTSEPHILSLQTYIGLVRIPKDQYTEHAPSNPAISNSQVKQKYKVGSIKQGFVFPVFDKAIVRYGRVRLYSVSRLEAARKAGSFQSQNPNLFSKTTSRSFLKSWTMVGVAVTLNIVRPKW